MKSVKVINRSSNFSPQYTDVSFLQYVYLWAQLDTPKIFMLGRWQPGYLTKCIDLLLFPDWKFSTLCFIYLIFLIPIFSKFTKKLECWVSPTILVTCIENEGVFFLQRVSLLGLKKLWRMISSYLHLLVLITPNFLLWLW